jgi:hypothetical protein
MATRGAVRDRKDVFAGLGDVIAASAQAMKKNASDARDAASQAVPALRSALGKAIYGAGYYASYGAIFAVNRLAPAISVLADGVNDGVAAARDAGRTSAARVGSGAKRRVRSRRPPRRSTRRSATP